MCQNATLSDPRQQLDLHSLIHHSVPSCRTGAPHRTLFSVDGSRNKRGMPTAVRRPGVKSGHRGGHSPPRSTPWILRRQIWETDTGIVHSFKRAMSCDPHCDDQSSGDFLEGEWCCLLSWSHVGLEITKTIMLDEKESSEISPT